MATKITDPDKIELLKELLFPEEQATLVDLSDRIQKLEQILADDERLQQKLQPLIQKKIDQSSTQIKDSLGPKIRESLQEFIRENPTEAVSTFTPLMSELLTSYRKDRRKKFYHRLGAPTRALKSMYTNMLTSITQGSKNSNVVYESKADLIPHLLIFDRNTSKLRAQFTGACANIKEPGPELLNFISKKIRNHEPLRDQVFEVLPIATSQLYLQGLVNHFVVLVLKDAKAPKNSSEIQDFMFDFYYQYMGQHLELMRDNPDSKNPIKDIDKAMLEKIIDQNPGDSFLNMP